MDQDNKNEPFDEAHRKRIEEIIAAMQCPKDFECYKSRFTKLGKARDIGLKSFLVCLEENPELCQFSLQFGNSYFCTCPLRVYIARELKK
jgi:hypothetical protein